MSEGTKYSPWQGRINFGASDASVILFIFSNFVCGAYIFTLYSLYCNCMKTLMGMKINSLFRVAGLSVVQAIIDKLEQDLDPIILHK